MMAAMVAWAGTAEVAFGDDGVLKGRVEISAPAERVHAILDQTAMVAKWSSDVLEMTPTGPATEGCQDFDVKTRGLWRPLTYVVRRCRKGGSYTDRLVRSEDFNAVTSDWTITSTGDTTVVTYAGTVDVNLSVPAALLRKAQQSSMQGILERLDKEASATP